MRQLVLLGEAESKRTIYFEKACQALGITLGRQTLETFGGAAEVLEAVADVCVQALEALPGLRYAGLDVLLDEQTLTPRIIEVNGQGDLIYQDIFADNRIYSRQAAYFLQMRGGV